MDEKHLEMADALTTSMIEFGINRARNALARPEDFHGDCSCGAAIQQARIDAGYFNCVHCQEHKERHDKIYQKFR